MLSSPRSALSRSSSENLRYNDESATEKLEKPENPDTRPRTYPKYKSESGGIEEILRILDPLLPSTTTNTSTRAMAQPPSPHERRFWYYGLGDGYGDSRPSLVARSSTDQFRYADHPFPTYWPNAYLEPELKMITTLHNHRIVEIYDKYLRTEVLEILRGVVWSCIDIVRLGYTDEAEGRPVVLITGLEASQATAQQAVNKIRALMER